MDKRIVIEKLIDYYKEFCETKSTNFGYVFRDGKILDMYSHNYSLINNFIDREDFIKIANEQLDNCKNAGMEFGRIETYEDIDDQVFSQLKYSGNKDKNGVYVAKIDDISIFNTNDKVKIVEITENNFSDLIELNLKDGKVSDESSFSARKIKGKRDAYLTKGVKCYVAVLNGEMVGSVEYLVTREILQIENLFTLEKYYKMGIAKTLVKALIEKAKNEGAKELLLVADEFDTPKDAYIRWGYKKCMEIKAYTIKF